MEETTKPEYTHSQTANDKSAATAAAGLQKGSAAISEGSGNGSIDDSEWNQAEDEENEEVSDDLGGDDSDKDEVINSEDNDLYGQRQPQQLDVKLFFQCFRRVDIETQKNSLQHITIKPVTEGHDTLIMRRHQMTSL